MHAVVLQEETMLLVSALSLGVQCGTASSDALSPRTDCAVLHVAGISEIEY